MEKESKNGPYLSSRSGVSLGKCPVVKVLRTSEYGMVVESNRSFDIGEEMTIGFHLSCSKEGSSFISADSLVVGSERSLSDRGDFRHRVTLLFSKVANADLERLMAMSKSMPLPAPRCELGLN